MSFLNVKIMLLFYIISRYDTSIWFTSVAKMMWTCFPQIDRKGLSNVLNCFLTVKTYQGQIIQIFVLRFLLVQSCTYGNQLVLSVHHQTTFNMFLPNYKNWKYFVLSGPLLANKVTLKPWNCYLFIALLWLAS
jgi:hypothetical protein